MTNPNNPFGISQATWVSFQEAMASSNPVPPSQPPTFDPGHSHAQAQAQNPQWQPQLGSFYFEDPAHQAYFIQRRVSRQQWNASHGVHNWTEAMEMELVNKLNLDWFGETWAGSSDWITSMPALNLDKIKPTIERKPGIPKFKIDYQTFAEIKLRLSGTVILIKGSPYYVHRVKQKGDDFYLAVLNDETKDALRVAYKDIDDCRTIPPMYVVTNTTGWLSRSPARVYQQGVTRSNTQFWKVDGSQILHNIDQMTLIRGINRREDREWNKTLSSMLRGGEVHSLRMSDDIAVTTDRDELIACYRGRALGTIKDETVYVDDEDDLLQGWIEKAVKKVGMELRA